MPQLHTPDVYIEEIPTFPPSVAEVATAIPAFVGYTEKAAGSDGKSLTNRPWKVRSLKDYEAIFGLPHADTISVTVAGDVKSGFRVSVADLDPKYTLYHAVRMFFDNGGGQCYVVSVGDYGTDPLTATALTTGLKALEAESEPTLLVVPEAVKLSVADYQTVVQAMIKQCGELGDRFAIIDVWHGTVGMDADVEQTDPDDSNKKVSKKLAEWNRSAWTGELRYGAAYYPFLRTTLAYYVPEGDKNVTVGPAPSNGTPPTLDTIKTMDTARYNAIKAELRNHYYVLPPSGAIAGIYAGTDATRGVWKAPANVALADVIEPLVKITSAEQDPMNVDPTTGKSINAIRSFAGRGTLVWGARTLDGNSNEWRYVSVRRFFNMVEESVKLSTHWAVFEPNDANTWVKVRGMIENYLTDKWRDGALAGATPREAFYVRCGLGATMSAQDILQGVMNVEIGMAVVRPAEFIVLKFSHKLQTS